MSNNVGDVKHDVRTRLPALVEERHFALVVGLRVSNLGSLLIFRVGNSVRPSHYIGDLLPTIEITGLSRVRTELMQLAITLIDP